MEHRVIQFGVILFWLLSMSWLVVTKIAPVVSPADRPDQRTIQVEDPDQNDLVCWSISWRGLKVGWARMQTSKTAMGHGQVNSLVRFDKLPAGKIMSSMLGGVGSMLQWATPVDKDLELSADIETKMSFDPFGVLDRFDTSVSLDDFGQLFRLRGIVSENRLRVTAIAGQALETTDGARQLAEKEIDLPPDGFVADALTPQHRLANLRVGQTWTFESYRPMSPRNPIRTIRATAEKKQMILYENDMEPTIEVTFLEEGGSGLTTNRDPFSRLWVTADGSVIRQEMKVAGMSVVFLRESPDYCERCAAEDQP